MVVLNLLSREAEGGPALAVLINSSSQLCPFYRRMKPRAACALARSFFAGPERRERTMLPFLVADVTKGGAAASLDGAGCSAPEKVNFPGAAVSGDNSSTAGVSTERL